MKKQFVLSGLAVASIVITSEQTLANEIEENVVEDELLKLPTLEEHKEIIETAPIESTYTSVTEEIEVLDIEYTEQMVTETDSETTEYVEKPVISKAKVSKMAASVTVTDNKTIATDSPPTFLQQFPDKALRDAVLSNFYGLTEDSVISDSVIQSAYELNITGKDVKDLTGIGIFTEVISIVVRETGIKNLSSDMLNYQNLVLLGLEQNEDFEELDAAVWNLPIDAFHIVSSPKLTSIPQIPEDAKVLSTMSYLAIEGTHITDASFVMHKRFNRLRMLILDYNHIVHLPASDTYPILSNNNAMYVVMNGNQLVSVPEIYKSYKTLYPRGSFAIGMDLTDPSVHELFDYSGGFPSQLVLKNKSKAIVVKDGTLDIPNALHEYVDIMNDIPYKPIPLELSHAHQLEFVELIDEEGNPVELKAYYQDGVVIKEGIVRAKIRSMPGANPIGELSPYALTEYMEVVFQLAAKPVTVNFVNEKGISIAPSITLTGQRGEQYATEPAIIDGYEWLYVEGDTEGIFGLQPILVTYVYMEVTPPDTGSEGEEGESGDGTGNHYNPPHKKPSQAGIISSLPQTNGHYIVVWNKIGIGILCLAGVIFIRRRKRYKLRNND